MIERRGDSAPQTSLKEYALIAPRLVRLLGRLMRDPRVPARSKAIVVVTFGYLVSPIDLIPDAIPGVGHFDDVIVAAFALDHLLKSVPEEVLHEHWEGQEDVLDVIRNLVDIGAGLVPRWLKRIIPG